MPLTLPGDKGFGGTCDASALARRQQLALGAVASCLDLYHHQGVAAPGDDIDLADAGVETPSENRIAAQPQPPDAKRLGEAPETICTPAP